MEMTVLISFLKVRSNKADIDHMKTSPTLVSKTLVYTEHQVTAWQFGKPMKRIKNHDTYNFIIATLNSVFYLSIYLSIYLSR